MACISQHCDIFLGNFRIFLLSIKFVSHSKEHHSIYMRILCKIFNVRQIFQLVIKAQYGNKAKISNAVFSVQKLSQFDN
jgi:hypothetical protein